MEITVFFLKYTATTEIYTYGHTLSLPDALPILCELAWPNSHARPKVTMRGERRAISEPPARLQSCRCSVNCKGRQRCDFPRSSGGSSTVGGRIKSRPILAATARAPPLRLRPTARRRSPERRRKHRMGPGRERRGKDG